MAKLTMAMRRRLPSTAFAVPSKAPGPGSFPIPDAGHAKSAIGHSGFAGKRKAVVKAMARKVIKRDTKQVDGEQKNY